MEQEIEKLKQAYRATKPPTELEFYGYEDVMDRIKNRRNALPVYRFVGMVIIILIALGGFAGVTLASKPNSTLYPLKVAAQNAIANIAHTSPKNVEDAIENIIPSKKVTPTVVPAIIQSAPTFSPTPIEKKKIEREDTEEERRVEDKSSHQEELKTENEHSQEVKGTTISKKSDGKQENSTEDEQNRGNSGERKQEVNNNSSKHEND